jgi:hypothetical protein
VPINRDRDRSAGAYTGTDGLWASSSFGRLMITTERRGEIVVLALHGNLDMASESGLMQALATGAGARLPPAGD